jgi:hypothetical protein
MLCDAVPVLYNAVLVLRDAVRDVLVIGDVGEARGEDGTLGERRLM